jgi:C_GCAxxG_C_C family probable redox protein
MLKSLLIKQNQGGIFMKKEQGVKCFNSGCNCSQAVVMPYSEQLNVESDLIERISVAFGGGMGRQGKTCGCVSGALMVLGLAYGNESSKKVEQRIKAYEIAKKFIETFKNEYGTTECKELIRLDLNKSADMEKAQKEQVFSNRCSKIVEKTIEMLEDGFIE